MEPIQYKGFTIKQDAHDPYEKNINYMFFPTKVGECHDFDLDDDSYIYCGNCQWADTLEEAVEMIDELLTETI